MNGDFISRPALLKEIKLQKSYAGEMRQQSYRTGFIVSLSMLEGKIAEIPVVDAEPVRHGKWIDKLSDCYWPEDKICSECGAEYSFCKVQNYCPNCGAKMDAKEEEK